MAKYDEYEGSPTSQLIQLISNIGHNQDVDIEIGIVKESFPDIKIQLNGLSFPLEKEDLIVGENVMERSMTLVDPDTNVEKEYKVLSPLKPGDRVILLCLVDEQVYVLIDKAVIL